MGRFTDDWVVDRSMFEYVNQGSCTCCGISHAGMNMMEFMQACSDLETDDGKKEVQSPWPVFMKNEIWSDRVKIRNMMKKEMARFAEDLEEHGEGMVEHLYNIPANSLTRLFQLPRDELSEIIQEKYDVRGAFLVVFCAVVEQVANFPVTGYSNDGRGEEELDFEEALTYNKRCGFTLNFEEHLDATGAFASFLKRFGGPKLMPRSSKSKGAAAAMVSEEKEDDKESAGDEKEDDNEEEEEEEEEKEVVGQRGQSFRADRRLARLIIGRYWFDRLLQSYKKELKNKDLEESKAEEPILQLNNLGALKLS
ncbi:hypothetical protein TrCOL_g4805 [Triparma columacea]|uniref:Uncharacterized protein n=1 Tax=Triparma columacea TaxID=722753 RepID=A0A9W7GPX3_9STRA|nr:hypothetical protein TrCOL_g4805 [Triparma columacea]